MSAFPFSGINLAITTPFDTQGNIDYARFETLIEGYIAAGVHGFVLSSGTGMHVYLSKEESKELVAFGAKVIAGRARVIAQTSALLVEDVLERTRHATDCGADGVMVLPPFFEGPTDDQGIVDFYTTVCQAGLPVIGYNVPQAVGVEVTPALFGKLSEIPNFVSVKDSSGDLAAQASLIRTGLPTMNGADPLAPYALYAGAAGLIWGGANMAPRTCVAFVNAAMERQWERAREIWRELEPVMSLIWQGDYVQSVYAGAQLSGYGAGNPRRPLARLSAEKLEVLKAALGPLASREASLA
ncbi:dihydrodipicolinate synthase family protein [Pseudomonas guariconensis]|uniref:dihydrodipicolinate synthase family protein n=1 Tax=Pseudomonas TaxID=286 RepID=UPI001CE4AF6C|nr:MULTISPECIES: dihydrodipicolinate synthase family protein [Pseudomonas]MCO7638554.1 dihydrodipicolinate synthase family protein [Pseudomonas sp. S 311-6]MCO7513813.1 dihydrodipicolinate synthase family protein [Pseudomonas putida]MCO7565856.1 dihydrodipicolinate synthase family protein [Pseudomonas mosselii]MCO7595513.1 dihydrodipicolinate synthase family protein [Pseudomonas guariconensis]MCO7605384.1 dihydrodipicolinate synthase family protein [Pseudomonas guariconensis]